MLRTDSGKLSGTSGLVPEDPGRSPESLQTLRHGNPPSPRSFQTLSISSETARIPPWALSGSFRHRQGSSQTHLDVLTTAFSRTSRISWSVSCSSAAASRHWMRA